MEINVIGCDYTDTVLYLIRVLECMGKRPLIRDMTREHRLYAAVPHLEELDPVRDIIDYAGTGYTYSMNISDDYDTYIRLYDSDMLPFVKGATIVITGENRQSIDRLCALNWQKYCGDGRNICFVIKNYTGCISKRLDELVRLADIKKVFPIPVNKRDFRIGILAEYKGKYKFSGLSNAYRDALFGILSTIFPELDSRETEVFVNKAAKGGRKR